MPSQDEQGPRVDPGDHGSVVALVQVRSAAVVDDAGARLSEAGFTVGPASGPTFAIEASVATFEETFGVAPVPAGDGGWTTGHGDELPLTRLPDELQREVVAVAFERPAELHGPGPS